MRRRELDAEYVELTHPNVARSPPAPRSASVRAAETAHPLPTTLYSAFEPTKQLAVLHICLSAAPRERATHGTEPESAERKATPGRIEIEWC